MAEDVTERCDKPISEARASCSPFITPDQALQATASNPGNYFVRPDTGQLNTIFTAVAADISSGASRLVDDDWG